MCVLKNAFTCGHAEVSRCGEGGTCGGAETCAAVWSLFMSHQCLQRPYVLLAVCFGGFLQPAAFLQTWPGFKAGGKTFQGFFLTLTPMFSQHIKLFGGPFS